MVIPSYPSGVPQPLNGDRQSTRGQCPNTGGFGLGVPQPLNSDRQRTQGQCLNTGRSNVENRDVWIPKMGLNLTSFARFMELPKGRDMKYSVLVFTGKQCPRSEFSAFLRAWMKCCTFFVAEKRCFQERMFRLRGVPVGMPTGAPPGGFPSR